MSKKTSSSLKLRDQLQEKEKEYYGKDDMLGMTLLTNPSNISSSRNIMFTSHLNQLMTMTNPDYPLVFTNYENVVGQFSSGRVHAKSRRVVTHKVPKFNIEGIADHLYTMFVYDEEKDKHHVIYKKNVEDLTEKFGYAYDNKNMDTKQVGDYFEEDEVIYQSTSYDEEGNYRYGVNAPFVYLISNDTIEDAIVVSKSLADETLSKEVETVKVSLNDNDILINLFGGDNKHKGFPDIGEYTDNVLCARRRIQSRQLLFDIKSDNLQRMDANADTIFYCKGKVTDINIYCNKDPEELEENAINSQLVKYIKLQKEYFERILEITTDILDSGSSYSSEITFLHKRAKEVLNPAIKWKEEQSKAFSNIVVEFLVERDAGLEVGQKITGRFGNKGVMSQIRADEDMPVLENGKRVDIIFNALGVVNRLNSQQIFENSITFIMARTVERMGDLMEEGSVNEAVQLMIKMIGYFNKEESERMTEFVDSISELQLSSLLGDVLEDGINIHIPPMLWGEDSLYSKIKDIYANEPWIKPYSVYIKKFGRYIKMVNELYVGSMYIMKLKQTAKKGLSVRSTGHTSHRGLPEKTKRNHMELYSKTPIRIGGDENNNMNIGVNSDVINTLHMYYRSSVHGRQMLAQALGEKVEDVGTDDLQDSRINNRNIEIFNAYNKVLGIKMVFEDPNKTMVLLNTKNKESVHELKDGTFIIGSDEDAFKGNIRIDVINRLNENSKTIEFVSMEEFNEFIEGEVNRIYDNM